MSLVEDVFTTTAFIQTLGIQFDGAKDGVCLASMEILKGHLQQNGFVHAGVLTTLADHCAGGAVMSLSGKPVMTAEYKINFLRPACSPKISCRSDVIKLGKTLSLVESSVSELWDQSDKPCKLLAKMQATIVNVPSSKLGD